MRKNIFKLSLIAISFLLSADNTKVSLTHALDSSDENNTITFEVIPTKSQDPGEQYEVKAIVNMDGKKLCKSCPVQWFLDNQSSSISQPGDQLVPHSDVTNERGAANVTVVSYVPNRKLIIKVTSIEDGSMITNQVLLPYKNKPLLAFIQLVRYYVGQGYIFPPFGNILAKATKQIYTGGDSRQIHLEWNIPFGTKRVDIYSFNPETTTADLVYHPVLIKTNAETGAAIQVPAFENVGIEVRACTRGENCVDAPPIRIPKVTDPHFATESNELAIPNFGLLSPSENYETTIKEEQNFFKQFLRTLIH